MTKKTLPLALFVSLVIISNTFYALAQTSKTLLWVDTKNSLQFSHSTQYLNEIERTDQQNTDRYAKECPGQTVAQCQEFEDQQLQANIKQECGQYTSSVEQQTCIDNYNKILETTKESPTDRETVIFRPSDPNYPLMGDTQRGLTYQVMDPNKPLFITRDVVDDQLKSFITLRYEVHTEYDYTQDGNIVQAGMTDNGPDGKTDRANVSAIALKPYTKNKYGVTFYRLDFNGGDGQLYTMPNVSDGVSQGSAYCAVGSKIVCFAYHLNHTTTSTEEHQIMDPIIASLQFSTSVNSSVTMPPANTSTASSQVSAKDIETTTDTTSEVKVPSATAEPQDNNTAKEPQSTDFSIPQSKTAWQLLVESASSFFKKLLFWKK